MLWTPPPDVRETTEIGRYLAWLERERGLAFGDYDELQRWSVDDLTGFWASIWDFFEVRAHAPYSSVLASDAMPGAVWFPDARLNFAEHLVGRDEDAEQVAIVAHSQTRDPVELTFAAFRDQVARARAGLMRLGVAPGDRVVAYLPNIPETSSRSRRPRASARSGRAARRSSGRAASSTVSASSSRPCC